MAAFKFPHFRRGGSHPTLRERARSLACSTAKVLHLPVHPRAERPADSMRYGDGDGLPPVDAYLVALRPQFDQLYLDAEAEGISEDERARRVDALDHKADVILEAEPETIIGLAVQAHVVETLSHVGEAEILAAGIKRLAGDAAPQMVSMMKLREARQGSGGAPALSWSVPSAGTEQAAGSRLRTPHPDASLLNASAELATLDLGIDGLHTKYGDDADSRDDYLGLEERRFAVLKTLADVPARTLDGMQAKADALQAESLANDSENIHAIATSLARDVERLGGTGARVSPPPAEPSASPSDDPVFAAPAEPHRAARGYVPHDSLALEDAISDLANDAYLMGVLLDGSLSPKCVAWELARIRPMPGYDLFLLTKAQSDALWHLHNRMLFSAGDAKKAFHGPEDAECQAEPA